MNCIYILRIRNLLPYSESCNEYNDNKKRSVYFTNPFFMHFYIHESTVVLQLNE